MWWRVTAEALLAKTKTVTDQDSSPVQDGVSGDSRGWGLRHSFRCYQMAFLALGRLKQHIPRVSPESQQTLVSCRELMTAQEDFSSVSPLSAQFIS